MGYDRYMFLSPTDYYYLAIEFVNLMLKNVKFLLKKCENFVNLTFFCCCIAWFI